MGTDAKVMVSLIIILNLFCLGILGYGYLLMLKTITDQNKQITCSVSLPNKNGVDLGSDAYEKGE